MIARRRMQSLAISAPLATPEAVAERLLCLQGQDLGHVLWAVGLRCGADRAAVEAAFSGPLVRTWPMRGTLHAIHVRDVQWMLDLTADRMLNAGRRRMQQLELDDLQIGRCGEIAHEALANGPLPRDELLAAFERGGIAMTGQRGYHTLWRLACKAVIVVAAADKQQSFGRFEARIPKSPPLDRDAALVRLARRYFTGHGPATERDLAWWAGLPLTDVRIGIEGCKRELVRETVDGDTFYSAPAADPPPAGAHLLPGFDEMLLGYQDRSATIDPQHADLWCPGGNGVFRPTVCVDGRQVATWRSKPNKKEARVEVQPFAAAVDPSLLAGPVACYERFLGLR